MIYSVRSDRPLEPGAIDVLRLVDGVMAKHRRHYFLIGATARDILLTHVVGLKTERATRDLDIGIAVKDWDEFDEIRTTLIDEAAFVPDAKISHRLHKGEYPLDIIPFGGVETPERTIAWPPDLATVMNVAGYEEAFDAAVAVQIERGLVIRVVSLPGLAILKLFAWADRGSSDSRDAVDLALLLRRYADAGNEDRLYGDEMDVMESVDYRADLAGARLLGKDARRLATLSTRTKMIDLLRDPRTRDRLGIAMSRAESQLDDGSSHAEDFLTQFQKGLDTE
jgi:predicted nucleotidyltransferase